jgi:hypothetical protein
MKVSTVRVGSGLGALGLRGHVAGMVACYSQTNTPCNCRHDDEGAGREQKTRRLHAPPTTFAATRITLKQIPRFAFGRGGKAIDTADRDCPPLPPTGVTPDQSCQLNYSGMNGAASYLNHRTSRVFQQFSIRAIRAKSLNLCSGGNMAVGACEGFPAAQGSCSAVPSPPWYCSAIAVTHAAFQAEKMLFEGKRHPRSHKLTLFEPDHCTGTRSTTLDV